MKYQELWIYNSKCKDKPQVPSRYTYENERFAFIICPLSNISPSALDETSSYLSPVPDHLLFNSNETSFNHFLVLKLLKLRGFPGGVVVKNLPANAGDERGTGSIPGSETSNGVGNGSHSSWRCKRHRFNLWVRNMHWSRKRQPFQYSSLDYSKDRGAWWATVLGVAQRRTGQNAGTEAASSWRDAIILLCLLNQFFRCLCAYIWIECLLFWLFFLYQTQIHTMMTCIGRILATVPFLHSVSLLNFPDTCSTLKTVICHNKMRIADSPIYPMPSFLQT